MADPDDFTDFNDEVHTSGILFHSVSRDSSPSNANSPVITLNNHSAGYFEIDVTAVTATPSVVFTLQILRPGFGSFVDFLDIAPAQTGVGDYWCLVGSRVDDGDTKNGTGSNPAAGIIDLVWDFPMPTITRLVAVHADTDDITYSVGFQTVKAGGI